MKKTDTDTLNYKTIGKQIRKFRRENNLSQEQLAEKIDISVTHLSHIETGNTKLSLPVFINIAHTLQVPLENLLMESNDFSKSELLNDIQKMLNECSTNNLYVIYETIKAITNALENKTNNVS